jgi:hypothetical protein
MARPVCKLFRDPVWSSGLGHIASATMEIRSLLIVESALVRRS